MNFLSVSEFVLLRDYRGICEILMKIRFLFWGIVDISFVVRNEITCVSQSADFQPIIFMR